MKSLAFILFVSTSVLLTAQSKKEIKEAGIISRTENTVKTEKGRTKTYKESFEKYDNNGNKVELIEYKSNGDINNHTQFEYNGKGKVIKEKEINPLSKLPKSIVEYTYTENDRLFKELHYDSKNVLKKTIEYIYEGGLKKEKKVTNADGKVIENKTYTYLKE